MSADNVSEPAIIVNGINVDDLKALVSAVAENAASGETNWRVTTQWQGQTRSRSSVSAFGMGGRQVARSFAIEIDEPCELGGGNSAANPQEHLLAALNACMTVGYVAQCAIRGIELESLQIETEGDIDLRGFLGLDPTIARGYESLHYTVRIKGNASPEQFMEVHKAVMDTSPNYHNLVNAIPLQPTLVVE